jgi:hypothetical protein
MRRKDILRILIIGLCAALLGITGCDSDDDDDDSTAGGGGLPGTWSLSSATITAPQVGDNATLLALTGVDIDGNTLTADATFLGLFGISVTLIIDADGTWALQATVPTIPGYVDAGTYTGEGTYSVAGDRVTFTVTSVPSEAAGLVTVGDTYTISLSQSGDSLNLSASSDDLGAPGVSASVDFTR